ncbi:ribonuclease P protein component [Microcoleus sp. herbarium12]|uniref:ribonuclease P protein component n=1 Tax=Microcoleus sp. herbarium12 TaxID=3055437 RepID=UPI002FD6AE09
MLPPTNRLKHRKDFSAVYRKGMRRNSAHLSLRALRKPKSIELSKPSAEKSVPPTRTGISISLKVSKRAVVRNRIKRQIRAALRQLLPRLKFGWDLVIVVRPIAQECNYAEILQELEQLLVEAEVLDGNSRGSIL